MGGKLNLIGDKADYATTFWVSFGEMTFRVEEMNLNGQVEVRRLWSNLMGV